MFRKYKVRPGCLGVTCLSREARLWIQSGLRSMHIFQEVNVMRKRLPGDTVGPKSKDFQVHWRTATLEKGHLIKI